MEATEIISLILGSSILTSLLGFILLKQSEKNTTRVQSQLEWKQKACEAMGTIYFQLQRSSLAFERYVNAKTLQERYFIEKEVLYSSNHAVNQLHLAKGYLINPKLHDKTKELLNHYDAWIEKFHRLRIHTKSEDKYVFVGPDGYPFPKELEKEL